MNWKLPNQLTVARIILAGAFFMLLGLFEQGTVSGRWLLNAAFVLYIIAGITDVLDGWIARKYNLTSAFGRIVDPFVDKVLVVGTFVMLAGSNYVQNPALAPQFEQDLPGWLTGKMASGVQAWMVVVILSREFIVSAVRGYSESRGMKFPATPAGKIKMFVQSVTICMVLYQLANVTQPAWAVITKITVVWVAVIVTVLSGLAYVGKARKLLIANEQD
ncbi:MAG: CDP-alcohol phosphatidyltransferase family protein [Planctomycetota bacterium]|jgi:CDP-diacylglycerol--glycerol-3-phosphate 3-phosphatidyltransferase